MEAAGIEPAKDAAIVLVAARLDVGPEQFVSANQVSFDSQLSKLWVNRQNKRHGRRQSQVRAGTPRLELLPDRQLQ